LKCFGFSLSGRSPEENSKALRDAWEDKSAVDCVLECSGAEPAMQLGIHVLRKGGTFVQAGLGKPVQGMPILLMSEKELNVKGSFRYGPGDFEQAVSLLSQGKVNVKALISSVVPFERATEAWEKTRKGEGIKNLIEGPKD
jgi:D-xylulose reductase